MAKRGFYLILIAITVLSLISPVLGQEVSPLSREILLITRDPGSGKWIPLAIHELKVNVKVVGNLATTSMDIAFYNAMPRVIEGDFYFPLGEGQTVSGFAMEVNGMLREGVPVEKAKGRQVFESTVRQAIDPGLVELTKGNTFKSRIYPIPAQGVKRLRLAYEQELKSTSEGFLYFLPLAFHQKAAHFSLRVEVLNKEMKPRLVKENTLANVSFQEWQDTFIAELKEKDYLPNQQLAFVVPKTPAYKKVWTSTEGDKTYFYAHLSTPDIRLEKRKPSKTIGLIWDASGSAAGRDILKEWALLDRYFRKTGNPTVELVVFRNQAEAAKVFQVRNGSWDTLKKALQEVRYDGGTQLGSLDLNAYTCDEFLLFTDGVSNFGRDEIGLPQVPVYVISSQLTAEFPRLALVAQKTKGLFLNLTRMTVDEALEALLHEPLYFLGAEYGAGSLLEIAPSIPTPVGKEFSIAGILTGNETRVTLIFGTSAKVIAKEVVLINRKKTTGSDPLIRKIWAQKKIAELDREYKKNRATIIALGKAHSIVTRDTSLIVLDRIDDYVRHEIVPPTELQKDYFALLERNQTQGKKTEVDHIESVVTRFRELQKWWETDFPTFARPPVKIKSDVPAHRALSELRQSLSPAPPSMDQSVMAGPSPLPSAPARAGVAKKKSSGGPQHPPASEITLAKWDPTTPYLTELKKAEAKDQYPTYLRLREGYRNNSSFFLDTAFFFFQQGEKDLALRILSNISEMELENPQLLRILAYRLLQLGFPSLAVSVFEEVLSLREEEPQSYRDLGLALAEDRQFQKAVNTLYEVVKRKWDSRFPDIELIALMELNGILAQNPKLDTAGFDRRLLVNLPVDIRVVLTWDADNTDIDLWVTDPNLEKCDYGHNKTFIGGRMSRDFTGGYGPEVFLLKRAKPGQYTIEANYYGHRQQVFIGEVTIQAGLFLNFGKPNQEKKELTIRLKDKKEVVELGRFSVGEKP